LHSLNQPLWWRACTGVIGYERSRYPFRRKRSEGKIVPFDDVLELGQVGKNLELPTVSLWPQLREPPMERADLLLALAKILFIGHADFPAFRFIALDPVVGPAARSR
jgi:hypothetical protein